MKHHTTPTINYQTFFQSLAAAYIVFDVNDPEFTILEENEAHARIAMRKRDQVVGRPLLEAFPDTSAAYITTGVSELLESIRKVIRTGEPDEMPQLSYDLEGTDGKMKQMYWRVSHHPVFAEDGAVQAVFQATEDITDEIATKQKLDRTQYQLSQALSNGMIGTWAWDLKTNRVVADDNLIRMFGLVRKEKEEDYAIDVLLDAIHPADRKRVEVEIQRAIKTKKLFESEYRTLHGDRDIHWVIARGRVELDENEEPIAFPGVVVDITERKTVENNLKFLTAASAQFSASLDPKVTLNTIANLVVPDIADWCSIDLYDGKKIERVATAHKDPKKVQWAKELYEKQGPPDIDDPMNGLSQVLRTGEIVYYPDVPDEMLVAAAKDEEELALIRGLGFSSVIMVPMQINNKTIGAISLISTESQVHYKESDIEVAKGFANRAAMAVDNASLYQSAQREIKERKALQVQLQTANNVLESRVAERTQQLVETNDGLEKEIRRRQKVEGELQEYGKNLARSNQELQDFAYVASHDLQEPLRKIQAFGDLLATEYKDKLGEGEEYLTRMRNAASRMSTLIQDLLAFSRVSTKEQQVNQVDLNTIIGEVIGDLEMSITEKKGKVVVEEMPAVWADATHMRQLFQNLIGNALKFHQKDIPPIVAISLKPRTKNDTLYEIHVEDNGIGFDEKYLDRIFSVFQRLHGREAYEGTGIGLAVCRKIVERYGGTIDAKSQPNVGSTFIIKLPINYKERTYDHA